MKQVQENLSRLSMDELTTALIRLGRDPYGMSRKADLVSAVAEALQGHPLEPLFTVGPEGVVQLRRLLREGTALQDALIAELPVVEDSLHLLRGYGLAWHTRGHWELTPEAKLQLMTLTQQQMQLLQDHDALYTAIHGCLNLYGMLKPGELLAMMQSAGWPNLEEDGMVRAYMAVCPPSEVVFVPENNAEDVYICTDELDDPAWLYEQLQKAPQQPPATFTLEDYHRADILPGKPEMYLPMQKWLSAQGASEAQAEHLLYDLVFAYLNDPEAPLSVFATAMLEYAHGKASLAPEEQNMLVALLEQLPQWTHQGHSLRSLRRAEARTHAVSRDDFCPCGSGRKYGKCCGNFH